jgi:hypothetical protein
MQLGEQMANISRVRRNDELWIPARNLQLIREEPKFEHLEVPALKRVFRQGLERGGIAEIYGRRSSGRTSVCLHILAQATRRGEICVVADTHDSFDPASAVASGVRLDRLVWVRCRGNAGHAVRAADLFLHAGGFGVVLLDLCETEARVLNRIPLSYWYRFRRAVEHTSTVFLLSAETRQAGSCSFSSLELKSKKFRWSGKAPFLLLRGIEASAVLHKAPAFQPELLSIQVA